MNTLGEEVKRLRMAAGLTQEALAESLGVSQGHVTNLETGRKSIATTKLLFALCAALGVKCEHFQKYLDADAATALEVEPLTPAKKETKKDKPNKK